jgi:hypothetical protein
MDVLGIGRLSEDTDPFVRSTPDNVDPLRRALRRELPRSCSAAGTGRRYGEKEIRGILGENWLRVCRAVWEVSSGTARTSCRCGRSPWHCGWFVRPPDWA